MELIAMISMLIDHIGVTFFPEQDSFRIIGRLAFPIYAFALVRGYQYTRSHKHYVLRLLLIALLAQLPYMLLFETWDMNVVFTLSLSLACLVFVDRYKKIDPMVAILILVCACIVADLLPFEYGAYGLLLVHAYRFFTGWLLIAAHFVLNGLELMMGVPLQIYSLIPTLFIAWSSGAWSSKRWVAGWIWRTFYPVHLLVLAVVVYFLR